MKTYYLTLSQVFPKDLPNGGEPTNFATKLRNAIAVAKGEAEFSEHDKETYPTACKLHTIRANYEFWRKRFEKIAVGEAVLSIRQWVGKPYGKGSTQREIARLSREDGIGLQKLKIQCDYLYGKRHVYIDDREGITGVKELAHNDGLDCADWLNWFSYYDLTKPLAIIHFTKFRY